jgi:hypothetical protein
VPALPQERPSLWHPTSPPAGEDTKAPRAEGDWLAGVGEGFSPRFLIRHSSSFTRAFPPRVMPMHVSRSPASRKDTGRGTKPCHVSNDCLAAAGKTRFRAPFGGFSRATPVPLRHLTPRGGGSRCNLSLHAHDVLPFSIAGSPEVPDHHPRLVSECILCLTGTPEPFAAPRRTIFCDRPRHGALRRLPIPATPVPPRRIAMRCSRGGTEVILPQVSRGRMKASEFFLGRPRLDRRRLHRDGVQCWLDA